MNDVKHVLASLPGWLASRQLRDDVDPGDFVNVRALHVQPSLDGMGMDLVFLLSAARHPGLTVRLTAFKATGSLPHMREKMRVPELNVDDLAGSQMERIRYRIHDDYEMDLYCEEIEILVTAEPL